MNNTATTLLLSSLIFGTPVIAGTGHNHGHSHQQAPVNKATAEKNAEKVVISLIDKNKLDKSWSPAMISASEKKIFNGSREWVVTFINDKISDAAKQKLYVFLTLEGEYIAANYTGN